MKVMKIKKVAYAIASIVLVAGTMSSAQAGSATASINSTLNMAGSCSFSQTSIPASISASIGSNPSVTSSIPYVCSQGLTATITADRPQMSDGGSGYFEQRIYSDSSMTQEIYSIPASLVADGNTNSINLYSKFYQWNSTIGNGPIMKSGTLNFTATLTINF